LKVLLRRGPREGFLGLVLRWNIRFGVEGLEYLRETNIMSFGVGAVIGGGYSFTLNWGIEIEPAYVYIPSDDIIEPEVATALNGVYRF
jgi:hypothetical protein